MLCRYRNRITVDFTREPIIETVITPKEGYRLVVRSSKSIGQEEFFVEAVEVVSFGSALFFRSTEKPKAFLVPTSDYEVLEVREARMALKHIGISRSIKIGGGKEPPSKQREAPAKASISSMPVKESTKDSYKEALTLPADSPSKIIAEEYEEKNDEASALHDRKRERRRAVRRRRQREELSSPSVRNKQSAEQGFEKEDYDFTQEEIEEEDQEEREQNEHEKGRKEKTQRERNPRVKEREPRERDVKEKNEEKDSREKEPATSLSPAILSTLLPPPPNLIRETIARYRESEQFKGSFVSPEKKTPFSSSAVPEEPPAEKEESVKESAFQEEAPCLQIDCNEPFSEDE